MVNMGDRVSKTGGDYTFEGVVVSRFTKRSGAVRIVVEDDRGLLMIMNEGQVALVVGRDGPRPRTTSAAVTRRAYRIAHD